MSNEERLHALVETGQRFACLYIDPPWDYRNRNTRGAAAKEYPTMTIPQLQRLPVAHLAQPNAHLQWTEQSCPDEKNFTCDRIDQQEV
jgi:N6-adenosine-specific RNA methylase IME4